MKLKIYAVQCSTGSWDDFTRWTEGVFTDPTEAEAVKDRLNDRAQEVKDACPRLEKKDEEDKEKVDAYWKYALAEENSTFMSWNPATVEEYEVGKLKSNLLP